MSPSFLDVTGQKATPLQREGNLVAGSCTGELWLKK